MIKLPDIPEEILEEHWKYYVNSNGFKILKSFSINNSIGTEEKDFYNLLLKNDNKSLRKLILGKPQDLRNFITEDMEEILNNETSDINLLEVVNNFISAIGKQKEFKEKSEDDISIILNEIKEKLIVIDISNDESRYISAKKRNNCITKNTKKELYSDIKNKLKIAKTALKDVKSRMQLIFNYNNFVTGNDNWGAYKYVESIGVRVCPYCNRAFIDIINEPKGKTRPELDHYYPKSEYPFLALSLYNLIPSCHVCNSNFKGSINFYTEIHIHPYEDSLHDYGKFVILEDSNNLTVDKIIQTESEIKKIDFDLVSRDHSKKSKEFENNKSTFHLKELYNMHKDYAIEILYKSKLYNKDRLDDLKKIKVNPGEILLNEADFDRLILGNYSEPKNFDLRPLSKFMYDIAYESELLKNLGIEYKEKVE